MTDSETRSRWETIHNCRITRTLWPNISQRRTKELLAFGKRQLATLTGVLTGHCAIGRMAARMNIPHEDYCRSCLDEDEEETVEHLLCNCTELQEYRLSFLGNRLFADLADLADVPLRNLYNFIDKTKWFRKEPNDN